MIRRPSAASTRGSALARNRYGLSAVVPAVAYPRTPLLLEAVCREGVQSVVLARWVGRGRNGRAGRAGRGRAGRAAPCSRGSERISARQRLYFLPDSEWLHVGASIHKAAALVLLCTEIEP